MSSSLYRQTDRQTHTHTNKQTNANIQTSVEAEINEDRNLERNIYTERGSKRERDRYKHIEIERHQGTEESKNGSVGMRM